jgi:hypothetical protein
MLMLPSVWSIYLDAQKRDGPLALSFSCFSSGLLSAPLEHQLDRERAVDWQHQRIADAKLV